MGVQDRDWFHEHRRKVEEEERRRARFAKRPAMAPLQLTKPAPAVWSTVRTLLAGYGLFCLFKDAPRLIAWAARHIGH